MYLEFTAVKSQSTCGIVYPMYEYHRVYLSIPYTFLYVIISNLNTFLRNIPYIRSINIFKKLF